MPMLFTVMLASFPFAWKYLLPGSFMEYSKSILFAVFFGSNFFFYDATTEYGAASSLLKPFLHTWSLGVEGHFYIVFPIILVFIYKFFRKHVFILFSIMLLLSLIFANTMSAKDASLNFYFPMSRFSELLAGAILACLELKCGKAQNRKVKNIFSYVGLFLIAYSIFSFESKTPHPSLITVLPVLGSALIIGFSSKEGFVGKVLSSKPFAGIGLISYSAYLWHFPIFAFSRIGDDAPDNCDKIYWISLTFALSIVSYFVIEKPFRNKKMISSRLIIGSFALFLSILLPLNAFTLKSKGHPKRIAKVFRDIESLHGMEWGLKKDGEACFGRQKDFCMFANGKSSSRWIHLIGDSHLESLSRNLFERLSKDFNISDITSGDVGLSVLLKKLKAMESMIKSPAKLNTKSFA